MISSVRERFLGLFGLQKSLTRKREREEDDEDITDEDSLPRQSKLRRMDISESQKSYKDILNENLWQPFWGYFGDMLGQTKTRSTLVSHERGDHVKSRNTQGLEGKENIIICDDSEDDDEVVEEGYKNLVPHCRRPLRTPSHGASAPGGGKQDKRKQNVENVEEEVQFVKEILNPRNGTTDKNGVTTFRPPTVPILPHGTRFTASRSAAATNVRLALSSRSSKGARNQTQRELKASSQQRLPGLSECYRLDDKMKYLQLLQQFTTATVLPEQFTVYQPTRTSTGRASSNLSKSNSYSLHAGSSSVLPRTPLAPGGFLLSPRVRTHSVPVKKRRPIPGKVEIIDLSNQEDENCIEPVLVVDKKREVLPVASQANESSITKKEEVHGEATTFEKKPVKWINSYHEKLKSEPVYDGNWVKELTEKYAPRERERERKIQEAAMKKKLLSEKNSSFEHSLEERLLKYMQITEAIVDETVEEEEVEVEVEVEKDTGPRLPVLSDDMMNNINNALCCKPGSEVLVDAFKLRITRKDMYTLAGLNWLNDEVINFYMNLLMERGKEENFPSVYAFNTFFYNKLLDGGHASLRRWTRKDDIFSYDIIVIPVHLTMHWCLCIVDFRSKTIKYYDSMGHPNRQCLQAVTLYLQEESKDKKKKPFDTSGWQTCNVKDIPIQMNGSDCGVFACTYAEFLTRDAPLNFLQDHMVYFRKKMVYEILSHRLL